MRGSNGMSQKMKNITKLILFCGIFLALLMIFSLMMKPQKWFDDKLIQNRDARYVQVTEQPENTIDVLNLGDSLSLCTFNGMDLWREQGFTGFNIGADGLRMAESYYSILNACKKQNPKVLLIESLYLFRYSLGDDTQMLLSQPIYYRVPFLKYHNIWKSLVEIPGVMIYHKGYTINEPWHFHWFDENGKELGVTEMTPKQEDFERLTEYTEKLKGEKDINPELLTLYPLPMKDGLWAMAFVGVRDMVEGAVNEETMDEFLVKIPEL